jgi:two-component system sensor histidine kinase TctE
VPLVLIWLACTIFASYNTIKLSNQNFDGQLLNSADSVLARLHVKNNKLSAELSPAVQSMLEHNDQDEFYFQVAKPDGTLLIANNNLPPPVTDVPLDQYRFQTVTYKGAHLRVACMNVKLDEAGLDNVILQVGETQLTRKAMANQIIVTAVGPDTLMIVFAFLAIWFGIGRGLQPLHELQTTLKSRNQYDLRPLNFEGVPAELRPLVNALNDLFGRLQTDLEAQRRFVADAAHQLRTPVAGLKTYVGLGQKRLSTGESQLVFQQLDQGVNRIAHLVNRLLSLAKAERKHIDSAHQCLDLNLIAEEATAEFVNQTIEKHMELSFKPNPSPAMVIGDAASLRELIVNLVENAVLYTPPEGKVEVSVIRENEKIMLKVDDTGPGIPPEERSRIFDRFYRILDNGNNGCGIGLAIVQEIAKSHGAEVVVNEGPSGSGAQFCVTIQAATEAPQDALLAVASERQSR